MEREDDEARGWGRGSMPGGGGGGEAEHEQVELSTWPHVYWPPSRRESLHCCSCLHGAGLAYDLKHEENCVQVCVTRNTIARFVMCVRESVNEDISAGGAESGKGAKSEANSERDFS